MVTELKPNLSKYLESKTEAIEARLEACLDPSEEIIELPNLKTTLRFHFLRFDANGRSKFKDLAECLADHITQYCYTTKKRKAANSEAERNQLNREARAFLRKTENSGEAGEMLLYMLLEIVLKAPQLVTKIALKTNPKLEVNGSDGIHARWNYQTNLLELIFGESKLEKTLSSAVKNAVTSINSFHDNDMESHELKIVTNQYKLADDFTKKAVLKWINRQLPGGDCKITHGCLLGYNFSSYKKIAAVPVESRGDYVRNAFLKKLPKIKILIESAFKKLKPQHLVFEIFVLPFESVQEFRTAFIKALS